MAQRIVVAAAVAVAVVILYLIHTHRLGLHLFQHGNTAE
jgi:hypothetical protein